MVDGVSATAAVLDALSHALLLQGPAENRTGQRGRRKRVREKYSDIIFLIDSVQDYIIAFIHHM